MQNSFNNNDNSSDILDPFENSTNMQNNPININNKPTNYKPIVQQESQEIKTLPSIPSIKININDSHSKNKTHISSNSFAKNSKRNLSQVKLKNNSFGQNKSSNNILSNNNFIIQDDSKTSEKTIGSLKFDIKNKNKKIESLILNTNNSINNGINKYNNISSKKDSDSTKLERKYKDIKDEFEKQKKKLSLLKKKENITKINELEIENRILTEQCNKLNHLYFSTLEKLLEYENSKKKILQLKESMTKKDFVLMGLQEYYSTTQNELTKNIKEISSLKEIIKDKNNQLKASKKKLDYYFQLSKKLLEDADNIEMNPRIVALKHSYESQISEFQKSIIFYKEEIKNKDKIIMEYKGQIREIPNVGKKGGLFMGAQKIDTKKINREIIDLKNKINLLQEKNNKLKTELKDYEIKEKNLRKNAGISEKLNNFNTNVQKEKNLLNNNQPLLLAINENNVSLLANNNYNLKSTNRQIDNEDCDFMSIYNMNEFIYILNKCFEANLADIRTLEQKIFNSNTFNLLVNKENYISFILVISGNICDLLKIEKIKDKLDILSFVKTFLYENFIDKNTKIDEFRHFFLNCFTDILYYDKEQSEIYEKKISYYFKDKLQILNNEFNSIDIYSTGIISFIGLKRISDKIKINLKNEIIEYMIYFMKKACISSNYSLRDLNYIVLVDKNNFHIKNNTCIPLTEKDMLEKNNSESLTGMNTNKSNNNEDSIIEITNEEYSDKIMDIIGNLNLKIFERYKNIDELFGNELKQNENSNNKIIELYKLVNIIKSELNIELTQIDIFCIYSKFKLEKIENNKDGDVECDFVDYDLFKNEIINFKNIKNGNKGENKSGIEKNDKERDNNEKEKNNFDEKKEEKKENEENNEKKEDEEYGDFEKDEVKNDVNEEESIKNIEKIINEEDNNNNM